MTDWLRIIDRGIASRVKDNESALFEPDHMSRRLAAAIDPEESDADKLRLMNLCFDAIVCIREQAARTAG